MEKFNDIVVLENGEATRDNLEMFFAEQALKCLKHKK